jgi:hypothetical protein
VVVEGEEVPVEEPDAAEVVGAFDAGAVALAVGVSAAVLVAAAVGLVSVCAVARATSSSSKLKRAKRFVKFRMLAD